MFFSRVEKAKRGRRISGRIQVQNRPFPFLLIFLYIGLAIWGVVYVIIIGIRGGPF